MNSITFNNTRYHLNGAMEEWCRDNVGQGGWVGRYEREDDRWSIDSMFGNTTFKFKNEKDYVWFLLRWS